MPDEPSPPDRPDDGTAPTGGHAEGTADAEQPSDRSPHGSTDHDRDQDPGSDPNPDQDTDPERDPETPPESVLEEAERLTHLARDAVDDQEATAYREHRAELLADHGYVARIREDETRDVLVVHPEEWVEDGLVHPERIDDVDRGVEMPLSGAADPDDWEAVDEHNRDIVAAVRETHGDAHAENVAALADFMGNHYARPIEDATRAELEEFLTDYYRRNVWPSDEQRDLVKESVRLAFDAADARCPIEPPR